MSIPRPLRLLCTLVAVGSVVLGSAPGVSAAVWQWSVPVGDGRAFLWIPADCEPVRGVVLGHHNMIEQGSFEHPAMRETLSGLRFAEVWIVPKLDHVFDLAGDAGARFQAVMDALAEESGYEELRRSPIVAMGHSANATWPWNFAAWNPGRTLAVLSVKGDAPRTNLTGYGGKNPDWGDRTIDGVPGLMVMGEYEFMEERLAPMLAFKAEHPRAPLALLADAGHGHFDFSDELVELLAMFIRKAAEARLPETLSPVGETPRLRPIDPQDGWLIDRWRRDEEATAAASPLAKYEGDRAQAFWLFDQEMADEVQSHYAKARRKRPQLLGIVQDGEILPQTSTHEQVRARFEPGNDGITFTLDTTFLDEVPSGSQNPSKWANLPVGAPLGHANGGGPILLTPIVGPVEQVAPRTFRLCFGRAESVPDRRNRDMWLLASHPGDDDYKSAVQQVLIRAEPNAAGRPQMIDFPEIADVLHGTVATPLHATSDTGLPVMYYVREGPVEVDGDVLRFAAIPRRTKWPIRVTVVAWQWGLPGADGVQTAEPVTRSFFIQQR